MSASKTRRVKISVDVDKDNLSPAIAEAWSNVEVTWTTYCNAMDAREYAGRRYRASLPMVPKTLIVNEGSDREMLVGVSVCSAPGHRVSGHDKYATDSIHYAKTGETIEYLTDHGIRLLKLRGLKTGGATMAMYDKFQRALQKAHDKSELPLMNDICQIAHDKYEKALLLLTETPIECVADMTALAAGSQHFHATKFANEFSAAMACAVLRLNELAKPTVMSTLRSSVKHAKGGVHADA